MQISVHQVLRAIRASVLALAVLCTAFAQQSGLRPPAVPLVTHDPYFSVWSMADRLTDENTKHWTGTEQPLASLIRVDGQTFRLMGRDPRNLPALTQQSVEVLPTRTVYNFEGAGVHVKLTFLTPALPQDLEVLSRPLTYIVWSVNATDGGQHEVSFYFDAAAALAVNTADQPVTWSRFHLADGMNAVRLGSQQQPVLEKDGDNLRIDWGYVYLAAPRDLAASEAMGNLTASRAEFVAAGKLTERDDTETSYAPTARGPQGLLSRCRRAAQGPRPSPGTFCWRTTISGRSRFWNAVCDHTGAATEPRPRICLRTASATLFRWSAARGPSIAN
jgi:hypothetical protein